MQETLAWFLGWKDSLEKGKTTYSGILAWRYKNGREGKNECMWWLGVRGWGCVLNHHSSGGESTSCSTGEDQEERHVEPPAQNGILKQRSGRDQRSGCLCDNLRHVESYTVSWSYPGSVWCWKVKELVVRSCPTLFHPMDCSPPRFSVHGILQARILEWAAIPFSKGSSPPRDGTSVSCIAELCLRTAPRWSLAAAERAASKLSVQMRDNPGMALMGKWSPDRTEMSQQLPAWRDDVPPLTMILFEPSPQIYTHP